MTRGTWRVAVIAAAIVGTALPGPVSAHAIAEPARGLSRVLALAGEGTAPVRAVATFAEPPDAAALAALGRLGLAVQGLRNLPLALIAGPVPLLQAAVASGLVADVYPDERLASDAKPAPPEEVATSLRDSGASLGVERLHGRGLTGKGVGVAIVDSGVDATHPDLAANVVRNVKVVGPGYPGYPSAGPAFVLPVEPGPLYNSDVVNGHGTHVAGIVAADGTTAEHQVGVAPQAQLHAYSVGEVFIHSVLGAFDDILTHHEARNIRVVNNSWGTSFRLFDPEEPINVATKVLAEAGLVVVFAAGNSGRALALNPYAAAPWVIAAGSSTANGGRSDFSSGGLQYDNSKAFSERGDGHRRFTGSRIGIYRPTVSAPGTMISSSAAGSGFLTLGSPVPCRGSAGTPCTATLSGTSMAAPHVAGLAAILLQAKPSLTPSQVRSLLQATARPMVDGSPLHRSGYGIADAAAIEEAQRSDFSAARLARLQRAADRRASADDAFRVAASDHWTFNAAAVGVAGSDLREFAVPVARGIRAISVVAVFPALPPQPVPARNRGGYTVTLVDPSGRAVAFAQPGRVPTVELFHDLTREPRIEGTWRLIVGALASVAIDSAGPELPGERPSFDEVSVTAAQLVARTGRSR
ncbi:MAG: S8 family peptidase [Sporichthyaceae bacterium]